MKKNKYIIFAAIGFELIALILISLWLGDWIEQKGHSGAQAISVVVAFFIWFTSLILKLKALKSD